MKSYKIYIFNLLYLIAFCAGANYEIDVKSCNKNDGLNCDVNLKKVNTHDESNYDVKLVSTSTGREVFPGIEYNTSMENLSLQSINEKYIFMKESSASGKNVELVSFNLKNQKPTDIKIFNFDSSVNIKKRVIEWSGVECIIDKDSYLTSGEPTILNALSLLCDNKIASTYGTKISGNDLMFNMMTIKKNEPTGEISVVALDSVGSDHLNVMNLGCLKGCSSNGNQIRYIGKINNKFRITLNILKTGSGNDVEGYYYYDIQKGKLILKGNLSKNKFSFITDSGEVFEGESEGNKISGIWYNDRGNKKFGFVLYEALIQ